MEAKIKSNQTICLIGDHPLGNWKPKDAVKMSKTPFQDHGLWEVSLDLPSEIPINYKYVIVGKDRMIKWESGKSEYRSIVPRGFEMIVDDGTFGQEAGNIWVDEGWLTSEIQLRVELGYHDPIHGKYYEPLSFYNNKLSEKEVSLHFYDGQQVISHEIVQVPLKERWTEVIFHTNSLEDLRIYVELYTVDGDRIQNRLGKTVINCAKLQMRGFSSCPIFDTDLEHIGELNIKYLVITPFQHKHNNLSTMWNSISSKPVGKSFGHRGCGSTRTTVICMYTLIRIVSLLIVF